MIAALRGDPVDAARALVGRLLVSRIAGVETSVIITEAEAYGGVADAASHAHRGPTARNRVMFGPPGRLYVYRSYGIHWCANIVCGPAGTPGAVLLRAGMPVTGLGVMARRRGQEDHLGDGPGKLCQALGISGDLDGSDVFTGPVRLTGRQLRGSIVASPRIGISKATELCWRFVWQES